MSTLILPVAGRSSRFPGMRPKWLLTMPSGLLMLEASCQALDLSAYNRIVVICLREHLEDFVDQSQLEHSLQKNIRSDVELCVLDSPTRSHAETIYEGIIKAGIEGSIYLKDCDNTFNAPFCSGNVITTVDLNNVGLIDAKNKSYVEVSDIGNVVNIVEKSVIGNLFCCGGYSFDSAKRFCETYLRISQSDIANEIYISHVVYSMMLDGEVFTVQGAVDYIDWGTLREYREYCGHYLTIFCDVDGVLLNNGSKFGKNGWATDVIKENVQTLAELQKRGLLFLVVTTSRPNSEQDYVAAKLNEYGLKIDCFVGGLPHTKRVLINDFSATNPYPSAISINLERNSRELSSLLNFISE